MTTAVPDVIQRYFDATNARDSEALVACFAEDAVATDEGRTYTGLDDIHAPRVCSRVHGTVRWAGSG